MATVSRESSSGFGDPMVEFNMNLIGPPPIMNLPDILRYEPGFSLDLIIDVAIPIGQYDNTQSLNLGQKSILRSYWHTNDLATGAVDTRQPYDDRGLSLDLVLWGQRRFLSDKTWRATQRSNSKRI